MKKLIKTGLIFGLILLMAGSAWALPIVEGDEITMSITGADDPWVPYLMTNNDTSASWTSYTAFCIEFAGTFSPGSTFVVGSTGTVKVETQWLYASFLDGTYTDATEIQLAIWWVEEEVGSVDYWNLFATEFASADVTTFLAGWDIQAVNFKDGDGQNQVVGEYNPVPEPATMFLFGIGLLGIAGMGRKKIKK
jgi:PEP-CTERM motif